MMGYNYNYSFPPPPLPTEAPSPPPPPPPPSPPPPPPTSPPRTPPPPRSRPPLPSNVNGFMEQWPTSKPSSQPKFRPPPPSNANGYMEPWPTSKPSSQPKPRPPPPSNVNGYMEQWPSSRQPPPPKPRPPSPSNVNGYIEQWPTSRQLPPPKPRPPPPSNINGFPEQWSSRQHPQFKSRPPSPSYANGYVEQWSSRHSPQPKPRLLPPSNANGLMQFPDFSRPPPPLPGKYRDYNDGYDAPRSGHGYNQNVAQSSSHRYTYRSRYNSSNQYGSPSHHSNTSQPPWYRSPGFKKPRLSIEIPEPRLKMGKKKKPLSQTMPSKRSWTIEEAQRALSVEKEYNKRSKNHSLIVKFPDLELNKEIVAGFHDAIESVHFQQPSTARFCFLSLRPSADADRVIKELNEHKYGYGFLTVEYKKDREEDHVLNPMDIDPLTLYVGNLTQEVTKEDMVRTYPESRRIDIGYAKKMKFTRYAFVSFKDVTDCVMAFKRSHGTEMHSKSLIVRFRRINGPNGLPAESKVQNPKRSVSESSTDEANASVLRTTAPIGDSPPKKDGDRLGASDDLDLNRVKSEPKSDDESESRPQSQFAPGSIEAAWARHKPIIKAEVKCEDKKEVKRENTTIKNSNSESSTTTIKDEPVYEEEEEEEINGDLDGGNFECVYQNESDNEDDDYDDDGVDALDHVMDFNSLYQNIVNRADIVDSVKKMQP